MRCKSVFTSHSLRRTAIRARRQTGMQSHGGPQLVAELPQRFKKKQATVQPERSPWANCSLAQFWCLTERTILDHPSSPKRRRDATAGLGSFIFGNSGRCFRDPIAQATPLPVPPKTYSSVEKIGCRGPGAYCPAGRHWVCDLYRCRCAPCAYGGRVLIGVRPGCRQAGVQAFLALLVPRLYTTSCSMRWAVAPWLIPSRAPTLASKSLPIRAATPHWKPQIKR